MRKLIFGILALIACLSSQAQSSGSPSPYYTFSKGVGIISPDSAFLLNIRFRMQNRAAFVTEDGDDFSINEFDARIRRLRLRFDGFLYTPKLTYLIQLSFSRGDLDYESLGFPNIVRDAYIQYAVSKSFSVGFGQTKLPGNRQRVTSSGDLQLADRSIVTNVFNIDRDFGAQFAFKKPKVTLKGAISTGDGRNLNTTDDGLAYTGRAELLPMGQFTNGGDYYEGDLTREPKPKFSIGIGYSFNQNAVRTGGQLGSYLYQSTDIGTAMVDFIYKHKGFAIAGEYMKRTSPEPITTNADGAEKYVYVGDGKNIQGSYLFKNNFEIVSRYSIVNPGEEIKTKEKIKEQYTLGLNKYIKGHRIKLQSDVTYEQDRLDEVNATVKDFWIYRFQIEVGI
jgi:phosphate-selective porin OprO/OprP